MRSQRSVTTRKGTSTRCSSYSLVSWCATARFRHCLSVTCSPPRWRFLPSCLQRAKQVFVCTLQYSSCVLVRLTADWLELPPAKLSTAQVAHKVSILHFSRCMYYLMFACYVVLLAFLGFRCRHVRTLTSPHSRTTASGAFEAAFEALQ